MTAAGLDSVLLVHLVFFCMPESTVSKDHWTNYSMTVK